ncbi:MAG: beta strand repeat-containing protein, partial [bacterium]
MKSDATNGASGNVSASTTNATTQTTATGTGTVYAAPTTAAAGPDQTQCNNGSFTLAGNVPTTGTGTWSVVSGTATITTPSSATSGVTGVPAGGSATLRWTITNGSCPASTDDVVLTNDAHPTAAEAGLAQEQCNNGNFTLTGNTPTTGTGVWSLVSGTATITTPSSATSGVTGVIAGTPATLRWTITNGTCTSTDDMVLTNHALPTTAAAGADQAKCNDGSFTLAGNTVTTGTGVWTLVSGTATITTPSSATSTVTGIPVGTSATLRWTTTNGTCTSTDDVVLTNNSLPTVTITPSAPSIVYSTSVSLTASGASTYTWTPSTGLSATTGATVTATLTTTTTYTVTGTDANGCQNTQTVTVTVGAAPTISGSIFDDADGLTDGQVDGTGTNAGGLYVNLVSAAGNVLSSKAVNADGSYTFNVTDGVAVNTNFSIILTTSAQTVGNALSTASLVSGWVSMGEDCCDGTGSDGTPDSKLSVSETTTSQNNANFGVNRTPTATPNSGSFTNPGGTNTVQVPTLAGTDPEDGPLTSTMIISTLPTGGTLYYNGTPVTAGQTITSYDQTKLQFDPNDGISSASFTFKVVDAAGVQSPAATITMNFGSLSINGTVYDDADGLTDGQVDGTGSNAGGLFVNLVNAAGNVVASKAVNANGTYSFT